MAGYEAASKIYNLSYMSLNTLGTALSSYVGQNYGAKRIDRINEGFKASVKMCFVLTCIVVLVIQLIPSQLIGLFVKSTDENYAQVIHVGTMYLRIVIPDYLLISFVIALGGLLRGLGEIRKFFIVTVLDFAVRVVMCFVLTDLSGSYVGMYFAWYFGTAVDLALCYYWYRKMRLHGVLKQEE
jgi:Na+-driven multidrug efflux pump